MAYQKSTLCFALALLLVIPSAWAANAPSMTDDYQRLFQLIQMEDLTGPLVPFSDDHEEFDHHLNRENLTHLNRDKELINRISSHLEGSSVNWKLANSSKRLVVVPESRPDYADLFERYCREAVPFALSLAQLPNPLNHIATLQEPLADDQRDPPDQGVTAYLVHNIADEYIEEYLFFSPDDDSQQVKIKMSNLAFSGHIGSYQSKIVIGRNNRFEFIHNSYTLWQNSAKDPLNVFVAPIEETFHIALRSATESAILDKLKQMAPKTIEEVKLVVNEWMAVEEAVIGGMLAQLMPEVFSRFLGNPFTEEMVQSFEDRMAHDQYRYLQQGLRVVSDIGLQPAIDLYRSKPHQFKELITS